MSLSFEFCGEQFHADPGESLLVGREGPLELDDNQYFHRRFLVISHVSGMWWIENTGACLSATLVDVGGVTQVYPRPGVRLSLIYADTTLLSTVGRTIYEIRFVNNQPAYVPFAVSEVSESGTMMIGPIELMNFQLLPVLALSEFVSTGRGAISSIPSSQNAADRLGWPIIRFNRKLDHVCDWLTRYGVRGLHDGLEKLAVSRRARLVEYAVTVRLVTPDMLYRLEDPAAYDDANQVMDTGNALDNTQVQAQHVVRQGTATSGNAVVPGDGLIAQIPVFIVTDPHSDVLLAREISWMIVDAFPALRVTHLDDPLVRHAHGLWHDITRGIARRVAEATILKNRGGIGDVGDIRLAGLIVTRIEDRPARIAVSSGGMGIVMVDGKGATKPLPRFDDVGYDLPGDLWTIPVEAGQRSAVATKHAHAKLTGNQALVAFEQLKWVERAAPIMLSQSVAGVGTGANQAILVIDVLTPEDEAALTSPPTFGGEAEPGSDLSTSQLSGSWGLEALGTDHSVCPCAPRRSHTAPSVFDDFHSVSYLDSGGFSDVYLYEGQLPKRLVAIKVLSHTALSEGGSS